MGRHGRHVVVVARHLEMAGGTIFAIISDQLRQAAPDVDGACRQLKLDQGTAIAPDAAEVYAARRGAGLAFFQQHHRHPAQRYMKRGGTADNAAADDGNFGVDAAHIDAARSGSSSAAAPPMPICSGLIGA